jgi:hypothetical protein
MVFVCRDLPLRGRTNKEFSPGINAGAYCLKAIKKTSSLSSGKDAGKQKAQLSEYMIIEPFICRGLSEMAGPFLLCFKHIDKPAYNTKKDQF